MNYFIGERLLAFFIANHYAKIAIFMHEPPMVTPYLFSFFGGSTWGHRCRNATLSGVRVSRTP